MDKAVAVSIHEKTDPAEAAHRAAVIGSDPKVKAWLRRLRKVLGEQPLETWIYYQEDTLNLMALGPGGEHYMASHDPEGSDQSAVIDSIHVPGSDAGAW